LLVKNIHTIEICSVATTDTPSLTQFPVNLRHMQFLKCKKKEKKKRKERMKERKKLK